MKVSTHNSAAESAVVCFEIVRQVLDEMYDEIPGSEAEKDAQIREAMTAMTQAYSALSVENEVNHGDIATRFAYIYKYIGSHANIVFQVIQREDVLQELFRSDEVDVVCIGGGPGSEVLGILKYLFTVGLSPHLTCHILDKEKSWAEAWSDLGRKVRNDLRLHTTFETIDVCDESDWVGRKKLWKVDLFTMIYFLSEVYSDRDTAQPFFKNLFESAKTGALFVYVDNNDRENLFDGWLDEMAQESNLECIHAKSGFEPIYDWAEAKDILDKYRNKFGDPKLKPNVAIRIYRKP